MNYGISKLTAKIGDTLFNLPDAVSIDLEAVIKEIKTKRINNPEKTIKITNCGYKGSFETLYLPLGFCAAIGLLSLDTDGNAVINLTSTAPVPCTLLWERSSDNRRYRLQNVVILPSNLSFETENDQIKLNNPQCEFRAVPGIGNPEILKFSTENTTENSYNGWFS